MILHLHLIQDVERDLGRNEASPLRARESGLRSKVLKDLLIKGLRVLLGRRTRVEVDRLHHCLAQELLLEQGLILNRVDAKLLGSETIELCELLLSELRVYQL